MVIGIEKVHKQLSAFTSILAIRKCYNSICLVVIEGQILNQN